MGIVIKTKMERIQSMKNFLREIQRLLVAHFKSEIDNKRCYVSDVNFDVSRSISAPLWINMVSHGGIIACDLTNRRKSENDILVTSFFWRIDNCIQEPSDAKPVGYSFWLAMQNRLPLGFAVAQYKGHGDFRVAKIYSRSCVRPDDVVMEVASVFQVLLF